MFDFYCYFYSMIDENLLISVRRTDTPLSFQSNVSTSNQLAKNYVELYFM